MESSASTVLTVAAAEQLPQDKQDVLSAWHERSTASALRALTDVVCSRENRPTDTCVDVVVDEHRDTVAVFVGNPERTAVQLSYGHQSVSLLAPYGPQTPVKHVIAELDRISRRLALDLQKITAT